MTAEGLVHAELKGGAVPKGDAGPSDRASRAESPPRGPSGAAALGSPAFGAGVEPAAPARPRRAAKKPAPSGEPGDDLPF